MKSQSREYIRESLLLLIEKKDFQTISISEIAKKAGVTRITFYRHYVSKEAVLEEMIEEVMQAFWEKQSDTDQFWQAFQFFQDNQRLLAAIFKSQQDSLLARAFLKEERVKELPAEMAYSLATVSYLILGWCRTWYLRGMIDTPEEMKELYYKLNPGID